ncbi:hypothetical protein SLEP1_g31858 [Rubroshorea leprosula]|uniref:Glycoside hydrolase family 19 catalytic domain-containing protein n=1 Tax=Rubroshorea leprosula TaxID=152421 RepID=A0AAV5KBI7_9ROSI|nr:hypothetical protein SLEP1_g31858 [Rubroshorea leprosula]
MDPIRRRHRNWSSPRLRGHYQHHQRWHIECSKGQNTQVVDRIGCYKRYCDLLKVGYGNNHQVVLQSPRAKALWEELQNLIPNRKGNWCLGGDFNAVRSSREWAGCNGMSKEMKDFDSFITESGLVDLPMWGLERTVSDHCPVLLKHERVDWGPKPFKFFDAWLQDPGCKEMIRKTWNSTAVEGWYGFKLKEKLKSAKKALKEWSRNSVIEVDRKIMEAERVIAQLDERGENVQLSPSEIEKKRSSFLELWKNLKLKENMWQQKSRLMWLKEGDANTKIFHMCVKGRWRKNEINSIQINGEQHKGVGEIKEKMEGYFE